MPATHDYTLIGAYEDDGTLFVTHIRGASPEAAAAAFFADPENAASREEFSELVAFPGVHDALEVPEMKPAQTPR
jgi:hypothetical protein